MHNNEHTSSMELLNRLRLPSLQRETRFKKKAFAPFCELKRSRHFEDQISSLISNENTVEIIVLTNGE